MTRKPYQPPVVEDTLLAAHRDVVHAVVVRVASRICRDRGWDIEDVEGDVHVALLQKQRTASRFDPARAPLDFYVRTVVRGVVSLWLERERRERERSPQAEVASEGQDEAGLSDEQKAVLVTALVDARRVIGSGVPYETLLRWFDADRDFDALSLSTGVSTLELVRYLSLQLARLKASALPRWREVWARHWSYAKWWKHRQRRRGDATSRVPTPPGGPKRPPGAVRW